MNDWQTDSEGWKDGNEELLNEYEARLDKQMRELRTRVEKTEAELEELKKDPVEFAKYLDDQLTGHLGHETIIRHWILDENHQVIQATYGEWVVWFEANHPQHVGDTTWNFKSKKYYKELDLNDREMKLPQWKYEGLRVSTVFLGLDHSFMGGPPLLFETMIFGGDESEEYMERYSTWKQAEEGHKRAVEMVKAKYNLPDGEEQV